MKVIKRDGREVDFDVEKIEKAIKKANKAVGKDDGCPRRVREEIASMIEFEASKSPTPLTVEAIQDKVEHQLMLRGYHSLAIQYIKYRYEHSLLRKENSTDKKILAIVNGENSEAKNENANKNPEILSVQRDYIAGETSRDIVRRLLFPADLIAAHDAGMIHIHDTDYILAHVHNCDLVNLQDMLQNGTCISGTMIDKPHRFITACNIATQIVAQVASSQFGGQTITLTHLAPFVNDSRKAIRKEVEEELDGMDVTEEQITRIVERRVRQEIRDGIQTIQYQVLTLMTTNGFSSGRMAVVKSCKPRQRVSA